ncbi:hypothetical protein Tco_1366080, partial [Tanacetum coccineum]
MDREVIIISDDDSPLDVAPLDVDTSK